jgi:hypothetical protein
MNNQDLPNTTLLSQALTIITLIINPNLTTEALNDGNCNSGQVECKLEVENYQLEIINGLLQSVFDSFIYEQTSQLLNHLNDGYNGEFMTEQDERQLFSLINPHPHNGQK